MHVALFTDFHPDTLGGVQTAMRSLCDGLRGLGHRVTVFTAPAPGSVLGDADTVVLSASPFSMSNGLPMVLPSRANRRLIDAALRARDIDIIHSLTTYGAGIAGIRAARRHGVPLVQTMQSRDDTVIEKYSPAPYLAAWMMRWVHGLFVPLRRQPPCADDSRTARLAWRPLIAQAQAADRVIVPTNHFARRLADRGVDRPIHVVSNGIDDALLDRVRHGRGAARNTDAPLRVLWCGRLSAEKRPIEAIQVVGLVPDCTLDIYGSGPLADRVAAAAADLHDRVRLHGRVDQASCLAAMGAHDLLLLTSDCDTQGMVLLEAVAMGLPVLYCDPELSETVPAQGGIRTTDASVESFAAELAALASDRNRLSTMVEALTAHAEEPRQSRHLTDIVSVYTDAMSTTSTTAR
ncbi:glycosyltransferase [Nocardia sp. A7]|uniref:glycosyltransferase n=1 Tax=Nocardia sp. A7 TaxID=2789274 RepID=UPI00397C9E70